MPAPKRAKKIRTKAEFDVVRLAAQIRTPTTSSGIWRIASLDEVRAARDAQMAGIFRLPAKLAEATRVDYAIFSSFLNRLAPQHGLPTKLVARNDSKLALRVLGEADALFGPKGVGVHPDTLADIDGTLANHGVAFGYNVATPRADGTRIDFEHKVWPIEWVRWDPTARAFKTQTADGGEEFICHGDGRWVIYRQHEQEPWKHGSILALALLFADHQYGIRDRSKASTAHGNAKIVGQLPEGVALQAADGSLTPEAAGFLELLKVTASGDMPVGIKPFGATLDYIVNNSQAWQIFKEIIDSGDRAADRIYLGHDVSAPAAGGDGNAYLFGVRNDIVEGSLRAIERGLLTGVIEPWAAVNFGDSALAPSRVYLMPDADEDARRKSIGERTSAFFGAVKEARATGFDVTLEYVVSLADDYGITAPPMPAESAKAPSIALAPTDIAKVVRVNEARASAGLGPLTLLDGKPDPDGMLTVAAFAAKVDAASKADATGASPTPSAATPPGAPQSPAPQPSALPAREAPQRPAPAP